jgi:hypothetical protein
VKILLEGDRALGSDNDIRTKSSDVCAPPREPADFANGIRGDHGDARFVEDTVIKLHHLHGGPTEPVPRGEQHGTRSLMRSRGAPSAFSTQDISLGGGVQFKF